MNGWTRGRSLDETVYQAVGKKLDGVLYEQEQGTSHLMRVNLITVSQNDPSVAVAVSAFKCCPVVCEEWRRSTLYSTSSQLCL